MSTDAATGSGAPMFVKLTEEQLAQVDYTKQVVINAKARDKKAWDEKGDKYFILRDPLADYKESQEMPAPPPPAEIEEGLPDFCIAFPRGKLTEVSEHIKRLVDVQEKSDRFEPIQIGEITPEALNLFAEFVKNHLTDKLREIPKPMRDQVKTYLTDTDKAWVDKWINFNNIYDNWLLFRMVDVAEILSYEEFSSVVAAVLGECMKDKKVSELRRFFHETRPNGGFSAEEEAKLMKQCRESWPESKHLFDVSE